MASYYYLMASLPLITSDESMPITYEEFLEACQANVSDDKYELLENLTPDSTEGPLMDEWSVFFKQLKSELNYQRSSALGRQYPVPTDKDGIITNIVNAALSAKNPLEAERVLLKHEFEMLDSLVGLHYFDDISLFGYALKLKLLERLDSFDQVKGRIEFKRLFDTVQKRVYSL